MQTWKRKGENLMHHKGWAQWIEEVVLRVMACNSTLMKD